MGRWEDGKMGRFSMCFPTQNLPRDGLAGKKRNLNGDSGHWAEEWNKGRDCPTTDLGFPVQKTIKT